MADISLLPEDMKKKDEEERKKREKSKLVAPKEDLALHVPTVPQLPSSPKPAAGSVRPQSEPLAAKPMQKFGAPVPLPPPPPLAVKPAAPKPIPPPTAAPAPVKAPLAPVKPAPQKIPVQPPVSDTAKKMARPVALSTPKDDAGSVLRVSLIPSAESAAPRAAMSGSRWVVMVMIATVLLVLLAYGGLRFFAMARQSQIQKLEQGVATTNGQIREKETSLAQPRRTGKQLAAARTLLSGHVQWTKFFGFLERNTLPNIGFTQLRSETTGTVTLEADASSFAAAAEQIVALRQSTDVIESVETGGINADVADNGTLRNVHFTLVLRLKPEYLRQAAATAAVTPPTVPAVIP